MPVYAAQELFLFLIAQKSSIFHATVVISRNLSSALSVDLAVSWLNVQTSLRNVFPVCWSVHVFRSLRCHDEGTSCGGKSPRVVGYGRICQQKKLKIADEETLLYNGLPLMNVEKREKKEPCMEERSCVS